MIVVKIELWPYGQELLAKEIGRLELANRTGGTISDYDVTGQIGGDDDAGAPAFKFETTVENHTRSDGALSLIFKAIAASFSRPL